MASTGAADRLARLWQFPLLLVAIGLFGYAAYLFIDPKPGLTIRQRINLSQDLLKHDRPEAAIEELNNILNGPKLAVEDEARVHLLLAEALDDGQKLNHIQTKYNYEQMIDQTRIALAEGARAGGDAYRRLGQAYEFLGNPVDALENYRRSMALDETRSLYLQRKVIDLQLTQADTGPAEASLDDYLKDSRLSNTERGWAMEQKAELQANRGAVAEARALLGQVLHLTPDVVAQGEAHYHLGAIAYKSGESAEAERLLRVARDQLRTSHPLDAEAALLLGKIRQQASSPREAISFYQSVLESHPESHAAPLALLGRGECRIALGEDAGGLSDLRDLTNRIVAKPAADACRTDAITGLREAAAALSAKADYKGALELLADEQQLTPEPPSEFYARLAGVYEKRGDQLVESKEPAPSEADAIRRTQEISDLRTRAGDAYTAYSHVLTLADDRGHAEAMWKGVDLYDLAGNTPRAISALELFIAERPDDGQTPEALLRLGRTYQAAGQFDKAIEAFQHNQFRYPQSLAASQSGVPLAQAFIAKGSDQYPKAEKVLLGVIDSPLIRPDAKEFRQALFELSQLFYRTGRYEEAVTRLEEMAERYPNDEHMGQLLFLMADSYRKSASLLVKMASNNPADGAATAAANLAEAAAAKKDRLSKAKGLFDRVLEVYRLTPPQADLDKLYLKLGTFYRADCLFDLGNYEEAIKLYDAATLRYQDDPSSLAAYVQIVNAYCALGKIDEARTANERAKWLLRRMPSEAFTDGSFSMPKEYWEQWLKWTSDSGIWPKPGVPVATLGKQ